MEPNNDMMFLGQTTGRRDCAFAPIFAMLSVLLTDSLLWGGCGLASALWAGGMGLCAVLYLWKYRRKVTVYGIFCLLAYFTAAASLVLTDTSKFSLLFLLLLLPALCFLEFMDIRRFPAGDFRSLRDVCSVIFVLTFGKIPGTVYALFHRRTPEGQVECRRAGGVFLGLAIALPVLGIILPLLISSDAAFSGMIGHLGTDFLVQALSALILGLSLFILLFGRLLALQSHKPAPVKLPETRGVESSVIIAFLSAVAGVYLLYLFSQLSYFFGAFSGFLPENYTVAEYARRGFFEMFLLCGINLGIVFLSVLLCRRKEGKLPSAVKLLSLFLCLFSLVLAAASLSKIILYVRRFGMTWLRIRTALFVVFLMVVLGAVIARLFRRSVPYMKIAAAAATVLLLFSAFVNTDGLIARHNIEGYLSGRYSTVDMDTIGSLRSQAVVPYLLKLADCPDADLARKAKAQLSRRARYGFKFRIQDGAAAEAPEDWRSWNLCSARARKLLKENIAVYYDESVFREN